MADTSHHPGSLASGAARLHPLDIEDVAVSPEALGALLEAARGLLVRAGVQEPSQAGILKSFCAKLFWNENGGDLLLCGEVGGRLLCLPVPAGHWNIAAPGPMH